MAIHKVTGFAASDGTLHTTVEGARRAELHAIFDDAVIGVTPDTTDAIVDHIIKEQDAILDVLTTGPRSRPKARRVAGTTAPQKAARRQKPPTEAAA
jgi:hypothetical protein